NLTHTYPDDLDILLVGPGGQKVLLLSDVGGPRVNAVNNTTLTLADDAAAAVPDEGPMVGGTYKPSQAEDGDIFAAPAPGGPYAGTLSAFNGLSANGPWSLYVFDDTPGDQGSLAGGWSLTIELGANTPPTISNIADQTINQDTTTGPVSFTVGD